MTKATATGTKTSAARLERRTVDRETPEGRALDELHWLVEQLDLCFQANNPIRACGLLVSIGAIAERFSNLATANWAIAHDADSAPTGSYL